MLSRSSLPRAERELYSRLRQLLDTPGLLRGNLVEMRRTCGKASCRCLTAARFRHVSLYLGLSLQGKRRMVYVPEDWAARVREWVRRHDDARELLEKIALRCLQRLQQRQE